MAIIGDDPRTQVNYPRDICLHEAIAFHAGQTPDKVAVTDADGCLTYAELEGQANRLANVLRGRGVGRGSIVGVFLDRGLDLVIAQLGILKAGGAFAAFDPGFPREALARILRTVPLSLVITGANHAEEFPGKDLSFLNLDDIASLEGTAQIPPPSPVKPDDAAFMLFTSGSTGLPKAVLHTHRSVAARFSNTASIARFERDSVFAQISPLSSIDAIDEIFVPLYKGGRSVILPYEVVVNPGELICSLDREFVTHILLVPSLLRVLLSAEEVSDLRTLQVWMVGGEALRANLVAQFHQKFPSASLINYYGLTEGDVSYHEVGEDGNYSGFVPIGRPIQNTKIYLLNELNEPSPVGEPGEICVAGEGLFREYLGREDLNAERWIKNPFVEDPSSPYARLFRTGDMGRYREDSELEYIGRKDRMVKVRGFRVELGEVEEVLLRHPDVRECVVVARQSGGENQGAKDNHLVAYVIPVPGKTFHPSKLLSFVSGELPDFAVPSVIVPLREMPLSPNGKVDVQRLPDPEFGSMPERDQDMAAPRNFVELELASIWERLLHRTPINIHENFFEIGGDSLAAIELMLEIEKKFRKNLPISVLLQASTIALLAELLSRELTQHWSSLVPIRTGGTRPPLFCIHADGGVLIYYSFIRYLDPSIPVYGLQARGLLGKDDQPLTRIEEMAAHYISEIRTVQPEGPYYICGYSTGGFIVFEMARQWKAMGEDVALVGMLDAYGPNYPQVRPDRNVATYKLSVHLNTLRTYRPAGQIKYLWERTWKRLAYVFSSAIQRVFVFLRLPLPHRVRYNQVASLINRAESMYQTGVYPGDISLFRASVQPDNIYPDEHLGWRAHVIGRIAIHEVPGTHNSILREPEALISAIQTYFI